MARARSRQTVSATSLTRRLGGLAAAVLLATSSTIGAAAPPAHAAEPSFVTRSGTQLVLDGQPFRFTGMNIYAANSDGWCAEPYTADQLRTAFDGMGSRNTVLRSWFFQPLAAQKGPDGAWTGTRDWTRFDQTLAVAAEKGVHVIVTLTDQWGECGDGGASGFKDKDWYLGGYNSPDPVDAGLYDHWVSYRDWVTEVVTRYKDDPTILAWQLVNEAEVKDALNAGCPTGDAANPMDHGNILRDFARDISDQIRAIDPNHLISLGTIGGGQCGTDAWQYPLIHDLPNIDLCEVHDYSLDPMPGVWYNGLQQRLDQCDSLGKPLFVGESGIIPNRLAGGTLEDRAELYDAKFRAQFGAGVVGELVWDYRRTGSTLNTYDIGDGDPTLLRLQAWSPGCDPNDYRIAYTKEQPRGGAGSPDLYLLDPVTLAQRRVTVDVDHAERHVAWSPDGRRLAYLGGGSPGYRPQLETVDIDGTDVSYLVGSAEAPAFEPAWSPDGSKIAYTIWNPNLPQIGVSNPDGTGVTLLGPPPFEEAQNTPTWSPDGSRIAYLSGWGNSGSIKTMKADGSDQTNLYSGSGFQAVTWSPDGARLAFTMSEFNNGYWRAEIFVINADGTGQTKLTGALPNEAFYRFSRPSWVGPDQLLFESSDNNDRSDIYRMNADGSGLTNLTNTPTIDETGPAWRPSRVPPVICRPEPAAPTAPSEPLNVTAVAAGPGSATVAWVPPASDGGAELLDYWIFANGTSVGAVTSDFTSETITGLPAGTYTFTVRTQNIVGVSQHSDPSNAVTVAPQGVPPAAPTSVTAGAGDGLAVVSWVAPNVTDPSPGPSSDPGSSPEPGGGPVAAYQITSEPGGLTVTVSGTATSATVTGLANDTPYTFTVRAANDFGDGPASGPSAPVTPRANAPAPQTESQPIGTAGGSATTDSGSGPTADDPVTTSVIVPAGAGSGIVTIAETAVEEMPPAGGYQFVGQQVDITSDLTTSPTNPLTIEFTIDESVIRTAYSLAPGDPLPGAASVAVTRAEGGGAAAIVQSCTSVGGGGTPIEPDPCISGSIYVGTDLQITILTSQASHWNTAIRPVAVTVSDSGFSPKAVSVKPGGVVGWTIAGTRKHSVTNDQKIAAGGKPLFDSGARISGKFGYTFVAAGTYTYVSSAAGDGRFSGSVAVPVLVNPSAGGLTTPLTVVWASSSLGGYVFDVEVRFQKAGSKQWSGWTALRSGTTTTNLTTLPTSGAGTYAVHARLRNASTGKTSGWSPEVVTVITR